MLLDKQNTTELALISILPLQFLPFCKSSTMDSPCEEAELVPWVNPRLKGCGVSMCVSSPHLHKREYESPRLNWRPCPAEYYYENVISGKEKEIRLHSLVLAPYVLLISQTRDFDCKNLCTKLFFPLQLCWCTQRGADARLSRQGPWFRPWNILIRVVQQFSMSDYDAI